LGGLEILRTREYHATETRDKHRPDGPLGQNVNKGVIMIGILRPWGIFQKGETSVKEGEN